MKKKYAAIAFVLIVLSVLAAFSSPVVADFLGRYTGTSEKDKAFAELGKMSTEEIVNEMNVLKSSGYADDALMHHAMVLLERLDTLSADYLMTESLNESNSAVVRNVMLQLYADKTQGLSISSAADINNLMELVLDETGEFSVRTNALYALPNNSDTVNGLLKSAFYTVDEDMSYHILKKFWTEASPTATEIAKEVLSKYDEYSPQKICAALIAQMDALRKNHYDYDYATLLAEKEKFTDLCIKIYETYDQSEVPQDTALGVLASDPVNLAAEAMAEVRCEKAVRYMLTDFVELDRLGYQTFLRGVQTVNNNIHGLYSLAQGKMTEDDLDLLILSLKYSPYKEIRDVVENAVNSGNYSRKMTDIQYPEGFDNIFNTIDTQSVDDVSWR